MSRQQTRRKCRCCTRFFIPDPRNQTRQQYCPQPACRQASKAASQRRWLSKAANSDYFRGAEQVRRVQLWRKSHPGYWRKKDPSSQGTQAVESQSANLSQGSCNVPRGLPGTLQDFCLAQDPAFVGLISMVTGSTLQEDIAATARQLLLRGRNILGCVRFMSGVQVRCVGTTGPCGDCKRSILLLADPRARKPPFEWA